MPHVYFRFSIEKDAANWVDRIYNLKRGPAFISPEELFSKYPPTVLNQLKKAGSHDKAYKWMHNYLQKDLQMQKKMSILKQELKALEVAWRAREKSFFLFMEKMLGKEIYRDNFTAYLTTFSRCPYSEKEHWLMVNFWASLPEQITAIGHELLHLQFLNQYRDFLESRGLNEGQIQHLKEALTFLLNEKEFYNILIKPDKGYPMHADFRKKLKELWDEKRKFDVFLPKAIALTKNLFI